MAPETTRHQPSGFGTLLWSLCFFFVFALVVAAIVRSAGRGTGYEDTRAAYRLKIKDDRAKDDFEKLTTAGWVDQAKGVVRLPVADAKKIMVAELKAKKPAPSSVKIEPPLPMPVIDPKATEPPLPALTSAPQGADTIYFPAPAAATSQPESK
jgi:hypothetical protein